MKKKGIQKKQQSKVDILKGKIDTIFTKKGLNPPIWGKMKGYGVYFPKQNNQ